MIPQLYFDKIKRYFDEDSAKAWHWFTTRNPSLGGISPLDMIRAGKVEKLKQFIDSRLRGEFP